MKKNYLGILAAIVLGFIGMTAGALAQNGTQTQKIDMTGWTAYNPCCDEVIEVTGTMHLNTKLTENADGTVTFETKSNVSGVKGTGSVTGIDYNFMQAASTSQTFDPNSPAFSIEQDVRFKIVGKGKNGRDCSGTLIVTIRFAVDENGNITVSDFEFNWECVNGTDLS